jgi:hypothetical protein
MHFFSSPDPHADNEAKGGYGVMEKSVDVRFFARGVTQDSH